MEILAATSNKHKLREIRKILKLRVKGQVPRLRSGQGSRVKENGKTFEENAIKKVKSIKLKPGQIAIADDSGLMVDCLGGKPGVRSARFASPPTKENLCRKLLGVLRLRDSKRGASFVCVIAIAHPNGKIRTVKGICRGKIIDKMRGKHGFGYDPVFVPRGYRKTFAEMKPSIKNRISHRAIALKKAAATLTQVPSPNFS